MNNKENILSQVCLNMCRTILCYSIEMKLLLINCFLLVTMSNCKAEHCSNERNENNQ